jgi:zinc protease
MKKVVLFLFLIVLFFGGVAHAATNVEEVTSAKGIKAWLVEDHQLPLIAMQFAFRGGVEQDPRDKQGLATLTMGLLTQGAGPYDAAAFQQQLADHGVSMHFAADRDALEGSIKTLRDERMTAFDLLHLALTKTRFSNDEIERARARQLTQMRFDIGDPNWQARYALLNTVFGSHPYGERRFGTATTLASLTPADIRTFAAQHFARSNLIVAVAGDITPDELKAALDKVFGDLPETATLATISEVLLPAASSVVVVPREGTQTEIMFARAGPKRTDPEWYAADIANYILGGGGFSSRLMNEVRDKNGLTYGIDTELMPMEHGALIVGQAATDNPAAGKAWDIVLGVMQEFFKNGAKPDEITGAKDYLTGSLPLALTSTDAIASVLIEMQLDGLGRDYLDRRDGLIRNVTADEITNAIKHWFDPAHMTVVMVGQPANVKPAATQAQVRD